MVRLRAPGEILEGGYKSISIPKWYDQEAMKSNIAQTNNNISIPKWYD